MISFTVSQSSSSVSVQMTSLPPEEDGNTVSTTAVSTSTDTMTSREITH